MPTHSWYHQPGTPTSKFAPFFQRFPQLYARVEDGLESKDVVTGLILSSERSSDGEHKYYIVTNAPAYKWHKRLLEQGDRHEQFFTEAYLVPGSSNYVENMLKIGVSCYSRSEIPDEVFQAIRYIQPDGSIETSAIRRSKED